MRKISIWICVLLIPTIAVFTQETFKTEWIKGYGGSDTDGFFKIFYLQNGDYFLSGYFAKDSIDFGNGKTVNLNSQKDKTLLLKFNKYNQCLWIKTILRPDNGMNYFTTYKMLTDKDSNIVVLGMLRSEQPGTAQIELNGGINLDYKGNCDFAVIKMDRDGNILSGFSHGSEVYDAYFSMDIDDDDNIYLAGYSSYSTNVMGSRVIDFGNGVTLDIDSSRVGHFSKYSKDGKCQWARKLSHPNSFSSAGNYAGYIFHQQDGTILLTGSFNVETDFGDGNYIQPKNKDSLRGNFFTANYSSEGQLNWVKVWDRLYMVNQQFNISLSSDNGFYIAGAYSNDSLFQDNISISKAVLSDLYLAKCDSLSNVEWVKTFSGDEVEDMFIFSDKSNNKFLYGFSMSEGLDFGNGYKVHADTGMITFYLAGIDDNGNVKSLNTIDGIVNDFWNGISTISGIDGDYSNNIFMCGFYKGILKSNGNVYPSSGSSDAFLASFGIDCIQFEDFKNITDLSLVESAEQIDSFVRLTKSAPKEKGAIWYDTPLPVWKGFSTEFTFRMSRPYNSFDDGSLPGADGIAFVIQNSSPVECGSTGGGIGYEGITNSLAIEFDTYRNQDDPINDPDGNHVAVFCNGINPNNSYHKAMSNLGSSSSIIPIKADSTIYHARIEYIQNDRKLEIYLDNTGEFIKPVLVIDSIELTKIFNLRNGNSGFVGLTSATGTSYENQDLLSWSLCINTKSMPTGVGERQIESASAIDITPNPGKDYIEISYPPSGEGTVCVSILDILGTEVLNNYQLSIANSQLRIDISHLSPGVYFVRVGEFVRKFIKI